MQTRDVLVRDVTFDKFYCYIFPCFCLFLFGATSNKTHSPQVMYRPSLHAPSLCWKAFTMLVSSWGCTGSTHTETHTYTHTHTHPHTRTHTLCSTCYLVACIPHTEAREGREGGGGGGVGNKLGYLVWACSSSPCVCKLAIRPSSI